MLDRRFGLADGFDTYDDRIRRNPDEGARLEAERPRRRGDGCGAGVAERQATPPFFMWVHLYDPHAPYEPPAEFQAKAGGNPYDGEVAYADAQVARLVDALRKRGLAERDGRGRSPATTAKASVSTASRRTGCSRTTRR